MKCSVCSKLYPENVNDVCYYCPRIICQQCDKFYVGIPINRFFQTYNKVACYKCYVDSKYRHLF